MSPEEFGNLHYGYVGRAAGYSLAKLRIGSFYFANKSSPVKIFDELFHDQPFIALGYRLYGRWGKKRAHGGLNLYCQQLLNYYGFGRA